LLLQPRGNAQHVALPVIPEEHGEDEMKEEDGEDN
jgi:hypothetical protein